MLIVRKSRIQERAYADGHRARKKFGEYTGERISIGPGKKENQGKERINIIELSDTEAIDGSVGRWALSVQSFIRAIPNVFTASPTGERNSIPCGM